MDIDSINAGTVDTKGWLNPVVGTLRAAKIYCDDIEGGGGGGTEMDFTPGTLVSLKVKFSIGIPDYNSPV